MMKNKNKKSLSKAKLIIVEGSNIMVLEKSKKEKRYVLAGGFLKKRESPEQALLREVQEETGVTLTLSEVRYFSTSLISKFGRKDEIRHYFLLMTQGHEFVNKEPKNFKTIRWINWEKALVFLNRHDKNVLERFYSQIVYSDAFKIL